jgi:hypothetical protein
MRDKDLHTDEPALSQDIAENLERAEELLLEAFGLLKDCMPAALAGAIATQVIEDLVSLAAPQPHLH